MIIRFGLQALLFLFLFMPAAILQAADITLWDVVGNADKDQRPILTEEIPIEHYF